MHALPHCQHKAKKTREEGNKKHSHANCLSEVEELDSGICIYFFFFFLLCLKITSDITFDQKTLFKKMVLKREVTTRTP